MRVDWTRVNETQFEELCHDLVRLALGDKKHYYEPRNMPHQPDFQCDGILRRCQFERLKPPVVFSFKTSDPRSADKDASRTITDEFLKYKDRLLQNRPRSVVLWTNHRMRPTDRRRIEHALPRVDLLITGGCDLEPRLLQNAHLLTKYFGWSEYISCYSTDDPESLRNALVGSPWDSAVPLEGVPHPRLKSLVSPRGKRLRIVGAPGSGKSFLLYQLVRSFGQARIVVLRSLDKALVWEHLTDIMESTDGHVVLVVDNLHEKTDRTYATDVLGPLMDFVGRLTREVTILVSYWSTKRSDVERAVAPTNWMRWRFEELEMDNPPSGFIAEIVKAACQSLSIEIDDGIREEFVKRIIEWENTPACAVASLLPYQGKRVRSSDGFFPVFLKERDDWWRRLFDELFSDRDTPEATVLRSASVVRWCAERAPGLATVREVAAIVGGLTSAAFDNAVEQLEKNRWLRRDGLLLQSHDLQLFPQTVNLFRNDTPSPFLEAYASAVRANSIPSMAEYRLLALQRIGHMFWDMQLFYKCVEFCEEILLSEPTNVRVLCNKAVALDRLGSSEEALTVLRAAIALAPSDIRVVETYCAICQRLSRTSDITDALVNAEKHLPPGARELHHLAELSLLLRETDQALTCANRLLEADPDDPGSWATLVRVLFVRGEGERAMSALDKALATWPDDGSLLFVKADMLSQKRDVKALDEALEIAERALRVLPNNPSIYALVGFLSLQLNKIARASEVTKTGTELFAFWPDLLAVRGIVLENEHKLEEAKRTLMKAQNSLQGVSPVYRTLFFTGLATVCLRLGEGVESEKWFQLAAKDTNDKSYVLRHKARALQRSGRTDDAIATQEQAVSLAPSSPHEWEYLGDLSVEAKNFRRAAEAFRQALSLSPDDSSLLWRLGSALVQARSWSESVEVWRKITESDPGELGAWERLGISLYALQEYPDAVSALERAGVEQTGNLLSRTAYAYSLCATGRLDSALGQCGIVLQQAPQSAHMHLLKSYCHLNQDRKRQATRSAEDALRYATNDPYVTINCGTLFFALGQPERGYDLWASVRDAWKSHDLDRTALYQAVIYLSRKAKYAEAIELLEYICDREGPSELDLLTIARCAKVAGQVDKALAKYTELLHMNPMNFIVVTQRAILLIENGRSYEATDTSSQIYDGVEPWLKAMYAAHACFAAKRPDDTVTHFLHSVRHLPDPPLERALAMTQVLSVAESLNIRDELESECAACEACSADDAPVLHLSALITRDLDLRLEKLRKAYALAPSRTLLATDLAMAELFSNNSKEAVSIARQLGSSSEASAVTLASAAHVLIACGVEAEEVLPIADKAVTLAKATGFDLWYAQVQLAECLNQLNRFEEALGVAQQALEKTFKANTVMPVLKSLYGLERLEECLQLASKALEKFPEDCGIKPIKSAVLNRLRRDKECIAFVRRMGKLADVFLTPALDLAECLSRTGRVRSALTHFQSVRHKIEGVRRHLSNEDLSLVKAEPFMQDPYHRAIRGEVHILAQTTDKQNALKKLEDLLDANTLLQSDLWSLKALLLGQLKQHNEVMSFAEKRLLLAPEDLGALSYRTEAALYLGDYEKALSTVESEIQRRTGTTPYVLNIQARVYDALGRHEDAVAKLAEEMTLLAKDTGTIDFAPALAVLQVLPKCQKQPVIGLQMAVACLGALCQSKERLGEAKVLRKQVAALDLAQLESLAKSEDKVSVLALLVWERACAHLKGKLTECPLSPTAVAAYETTAASFIESVLLMVLKGKWPSPKRGRRRSAVRKRSRKTTRVTSDRKRPRRRTP